MIRKIEFAQAQLHDLERIHQLIDELCHHAKLDESNCYAVRLSVEEAYVNIIDHGYSPDKPGPASVTVQSNPDQIIAIVADRAQSFAPEHAPRPDLKRDLEERKIGGLGWHFIREMMDEIRYETDDAGNNRLTLVKNLREANRTANKPKRLEITVSPYDSVMVVALGGTIDALTAKSVSQVLKKQIAEGKAKLVADLARVSYVSSAGVHVLLQALREVRERDGDLRVTNANNQVRKVLELSGFSNIAKLYADVNAAVKSFEEKDGNSN